MSDSTSFNNSSSSNQSSSSSTTTPVYTRENDIMDRISAVASGLAGKMDLWADQAYAKNSAITDNVVNHFFQVSDQMGKLSNGLTDQYNNIFSKQNASLAREADQYNSIARQQSDMGQAGAGAKQAGDAALRNSEEQLKSYGIDPSSGRYAALEHAGNLASAASVAGAMNTQRNETAKTGMALRRDAVQVGSMLPAAIANVNNTALQANTGASNASLANTNTGVNAHRLPNDFLSTAMGVKMPFSAQNSQSQGTGSSQGQGGSNSNKADPAAKGNGNGSGNGGNGPAWMPEHGGAQGGGGGVMSYNGQPNAKVSGGKGGEDEEGGGNDPFNDYGGYGGGFGYDPTGGDGTYAGADGNDYDTFGGVDTSGYDNSGFGNLGYDPAANDNGAADSWANTYDQPNPDTDWGSGASNASDNSYTDYGSSGGGDDYGSSNYGGANDYASEGGDEFYAQGGAIPMEASPSHGAVTDDIPAQGPGGSKLHMNAGEFVIPQDVALWKGQEFFQNLINQSRQKRVSASAQPQQAMR